MHTLLNKIDRMRFGWNKRPLDEACFHKLCARYGIAVQEMPLRVSGFYYSVLGRHFIAIDSKLDPQRKLFVMFHEFAHFLFHAPEHGTTANFHGIGGKTRKEQEADAFAACAMIPATMLKDRDVQALVEDDGMPEELVELRLEVLRRSGF